MFLNIRKQKYCYEQLIAMSFITAKIDIGLYPDVTMEFSLRTLIVLRRVPLRNLVTILTAFSCLKRRELLAFEVKLLSIRVYSSGANITMLHSTTSRSRSTYGELFHTPRLLL